MSEDRQGTEQTIIDPVTGTYSRGLLGPRLAEELQRAARSGNHCSLFLFDVDYFKSVNDAYGHARGDQVLRQVAERVGGLIRGYDVLFRYGGDEFVLLLPDTAKADAVRVALRVTAGMRESDFAGDPPLAVSVSLGVATFPDDAESPAELLEAADRRNYLAKRRGRACAVADDAETPGKAASSRLLEREAALSSVQEFLTRLTAERRGALQLTGQSGAGHTRFLEEIGRVAKLRGFAVTAAPAGSAGPARPDRSGNGVLVLADRGAAAAGEELARTLAGEDPGVVGLVYVAAGRGRPPLDPACPLLDTVELVAVSPAALRVWLRGALQGEASPTLVNWLVSRSGGLLARAERELDRLRARGVLDRNDAGVFTMSGGPARTRTRPALPVPMTELVGRQAETGQVAELLDAQRLVSLVGPGGIGKTRLALAAAAAVAGRFPDGAVFVPLEEAGTADLAVAAIAQALELADVPGQPLAQTLTEHLAELSLLLVLDNFEQVMTAAPVVDDLLQAAPGLRVLTTTRERLCLYGEQVYPVPPLAVADLDALPADAAGVARVVADSPALGLFEARARNAAYGFALSPENLKAAAELCRRLDGLPLAIELAAARSDAFTPDELVGELGGRLDVLAGGPRNLPSRQQTMRGALEWSFALLDPGDRELFVRLGVFAAGCSPDAAAAVCGGEEVEARLASLVSKSLLRVEPGTGPDAGDRYVMLETIRAYAAELLAVAPDAEPMACRHAAYYARFAEECGRGLTGPDQASLAGRVERDYLNLRAAFTFSLGRADLEVASTIVLGLWRFWRNGRHIGEGREWLDRLLGASVSLPAGVRARVLHAAAVLAAAQDDLRRAQVLAEESLRGAEQTGDRPTMAQAYNALGIVALGSGDYAAAHRFCEQSLAIWREQEQPLGMAIALGNLTKVALRAGQVDRAGGYAAQALELDRRVGNSRGILLGLECLSEIKLAQRDSAGARTLLTESLALSRSLGDVFGEAMALHQLGLAAQLDGDLDEAVRLITAGLALRRDVGDREDLATSLDQLARLALPGDAALAARLLGAAEALRERHRLPVPADVTAQRASLLERLRAELDEEALAMEWATGQGAPLDLVVDEALLLAPGTPA